MKSFSFFGLVLELLVCLDFYFFFLGYTNMCHFSDRRRAKVRTGNGRQ